MITKRTKVQLSIFVAITLLGVSFVGARYAQLDRVVIDHTYTSTAHFADSGGIFTGAEVTYRGVTVGRVGDMELTGEGVDVDLDIENDQDKIPADTKALVGNRSAVGEQYVELQPTSTASPTSRDGLGDRAVETDIPITSTKWLTNTHKARRLGAEEGPPHGRLRVRRGVQDGGDDLSRLIDTSTSFIETANENFDLTTACSATATRCWSTQLDKASAIRSFARDLALVSDTLAATDGDLRRVIDNGGATANSCGRSSRRTRSTSAS